MQFCDIYEKSPDTLTFTLTKRDGKTSTVTIPHGAVTSGQLPALKEVIGWAIADPDTETNAASLAALDTLMPRLYTFAKEDDKHDKGYRIASDAELNRWKTLCKWYADQRGIAIGETSPAPVDYTLPIPVLKKVTKQMLKEYRPAFQHPFIASDKSRTWLCNGNAIVNYTGIPQEIMEFSPAAEETDREAGDYFSRFQKRFFPLGYDPSAYESNDAYAETDVSFDFRKFLKVLPMIEPGERKKLYRVPLVAHTANGDQTVWFNAELLCDWLSLVPGDYKAYLHIEENIMNTYLLLAGENAFAIIMPVRIPETNSKEEYETMLKAHIDALESCRVKSTRKPAPQETKPAAVRKSPNPAPAPQETKPHTPWTFPDIKQALESLMPALKSVGIRYFTLDDKHMNDVDGHPAPRIILTNDKAVDLPFGNVDCVKKWLAEQGKNPAPVPLKITQEDIDFALCRGSGFSEGKKRIAEQFAKLEGTEKNAAFLKKEYGTGGWSHAIPGKKSWLDHDAKGISISVGEINDPSDTKLLSWTDVAARINYLITQGKYITEPQETKPAPVESTPAPEQKPAPQPKPKAGKKPTPAKKPSAPQEKKPAPVPPTSNLLPPTSPSPALSPAETVAYTVSASLPTARVEVRGAKSSCPIVWVYDVPESQETKLTALGFTWANKRQGWWKKPTSADTQATA